MTSRALRAKVRLEICYSQSNSVSKWLDETNASIEMTASTSLYVIEQLGRLLHPNHETMEQDPYQHVFEFTVVHVVHYKHVNGAFIHFSIRSDKFTETTVKIEKSETSLKFQIDQ